MTTTYILREDGYDFGTITGTLEDAIEAATDIDTGGYDTSAGTVWTDIHVIDAETDERVETVTVQIDPPEPDCIDSGDHDWQSPMELVGGIKENPGVWGHGGGVIIHEACIRCGCGRSTDTWAQNPSTGEQGLTSVSYEADKYDLTLIATDSDEE